MVALNLLYQCYDHGLYLYVDEKKLKYIQVTKIEEDIKLKLLHIIKQNKDDLISILLANNIINANLASYPIIYKTISNNAPLSFAQERLWFIENYAGGSNAYNIPLLRQLATHVNLRLLEQALQSTISRHEVLHSLIKVNNDGSTSQEVQDLQYKPYSISQQSLSTSIELQQIIAIEINHIFHLDIEYPFKIYFFHQQDTGENYLLFVVHHIAFDGWSIDVFIRDLQAYYDYYVVLHDDKKNHTDLANLSLSELNIQYKDFSIWQRNYLSGDRLFNQLNYWQTRLIDYERLNLPLDKVRPSEIYSGRKI